MEKKLVNLIGDGVEELWYFPTNIDNDVIKGFYKQYLKTTHDSFEEFMQEFNQHIECERVFCDEIYI
jgi:hypothetical protein